MENTDDEKTEKEGIPNLKNPGKLEKLGKRISKFLDLRYGRYRISRFTLIHELVTDAILAALFYYGSDIANQVLEYKKIVEPPFIIESGVEFLYNREMGNINHLYGETDLRNGPHKE